MKPNWSICVIIQKISPEITLNNNTIPRTNTGKYLDLSINRKTRPTYKTKYETTKLKN